MVRCRHLRPEKSGLVRTTSVLVDCETRIVGWPVRLPIRRWVFSSDVFFFLNLELQQQPREIDRIYAIELHGCELFSSQFVDPTRHRLKVALQVNGGPTPRARGYDAELRLRGYLETALPGWLSECFLLGIDTGIENCQQRRPTRQDLDRSVRLGFLDKFGSLEEVQAKFGEDVQVMRFACLVNVKADKSTKVRFIVDTLRPPPSHRALRLSTVANWSRIRPNRRTRSHLQSGKFLLPRALACSCPCCQPWTGDTTSDVDASLQRAPSEVLNTGP